MRLGRFTHLSICVRLLLRLHTFLLFQLWIVKGLQNHLWYTNPVSVNREAVTAVTTFKSESKPTVNPPQEGFSGSHWGALWHKVMKCVTLTLVSERVNVTDVHWLPILKHVQTAARHSVPFCAISALGGFCWQTGKSESQMCFEKEESKSYVFCSMCGIGLRSQR